MGPTGSHWKDRTEELGSRFAQVLVLYIVALLLSLPLFIIVDRFVPEMHLPIGGGMRVDQLLVFVLVFAGFAVLVRRFRHAVMALLIGGLLVLTVTSVTGWYTFGRMFDGYADLLRSLEETTGQVPVAAHRARPFHHADKLRDLVLEPAPEVRSAAVRMATAHFTQAHVRDDEFTLVQSFSIFKEINSNWRYVSDPKGREYFAAPLESIGLMAGDCDDHAVLMAACIKAIGGQVRLVRTEGHVYPELHIGDDARMERAAHLIRKVLFPEEVGEA
ncbi:MAG: hypothetical protein RBT71_01945, partial [Flavobacteriales bacterium]|nr:hypothetical protein [Flavobacteriales bacterium]